MNIVIIYGRIVSKIEFKFIYGRYYINNKVNYEKYRHISIAKCKIKLQNESILDIYGYDEVADYMHRYMKENDNIFLEGRIDGNMKIEVLTNYTYI